MATVTSGDAMAIFDPRAKSLSPSGIAGAASVAGFTGSDLVTAVAIALAESSGETSVIGPLPSGKNTDGTSDYGLFQINSSHKALLATGNWKDPIANAKMAYSLYVGRGRNFKDWTTYTSGAYLLHMPAAQIGVNTKTNPSSGSVVAGDTAAGTSSASFLSNLTNAETWKRVGEILLGGILILIAVTGLIESTEIGRNLTKAAVLA